METITNHLWSIPGGTLGVPFENRNNRLPFVDVYRNFKYDLDSALEEAGVSERVEWSHGEDWIRFEITTERPVEFRAALTQAMQRHFLEVDPRKRIEEGL